MALKLTKKATLPPKVETGVSTELKESGVTKEETHIDNDPDDVQSVMAKGVPQVDPGKPWCTVGYGTGYTHNLGNYQSARVDVWITIPCPHGEIDEVYKTAEEWVDERITKAIEAFNQ